MSFDTIGVGAVANDGTGDSLRAALTKVNGNFAKAVEKTQPGSVPVGGTTGQVLAKTSGADYAVEWATPAEGGSTDVGAAIHGAAAKTTPVDADTTALIDSAASNVLKKVTWANIKATLKTYFDTLYAATSHNHSGTYQPASTNLTTYAGIAPSSNVQSLLGAADYAAVRTLLSLVVGTNVQAYHAILASLAGQSSAGDKLPYFSGSNTFSLADLTSVARTLLAQTSQGNMRTTGLGMSANGSSLVSAADYAAMLTLLGLATTSPVRFGRLGLSADADDTNRLAIAAAASLFNHAGTGGHQQKINKAAASDTASVLYQTGFSGRAEMGTTGDDDFHFKVSPDGSAWHEALVIDKDTGQMDFPAGFVDPVETREQMKIVALTQTAYDALDPPDADTIYHITDAV